MINIEVVTKFKFLQVRVTDERGLIHRYIKKPNSDFAGEPQEVLDARDKHHTPEIIEAFQVWERTLETLSEAASPRRIGSPREFLHLFTDAEKAAFFTAKAANVQLELWWAEASTGDFSLDHPSVALGLAGLAQAGILTAARVDEILGADFNEV